MRNLKVTMAFRGTAYHGFQFQPNAITVQETVEKALSTLLNEPVRIQGCSRTDTGVHAQKFVFSLQTEKPLPERNFIRGACGYLPDDITILSVEDVPEDFHARFSCKGKCYMYRIHNSESKNPFTTDLEYHYRRKMNLDRIRQAMTYFIGTHDFAAFSTDSFKKESTIRTIHQMTVERQGDTVIFLVAGDGFLYNMVRILIGTLLYVSEGRFEPEDIPRIMESRDRVQAGFTAPAHGLSLYQVYYDTEYQNKEE